MRPKRPKEMTLTVKQDFKNISKSAKKFLMSFQRMMKELNQQET